MLKLNNDSRRQPNELHTYSHLCGKQWQAWLPAWQFELLLRQYSKQQQQQQQQRRQQMRQRQLLSRSGIAASGCHDDWQTTTTCNQNKCKLQSAFSLALWLFPPLFRSARFSYVLSCCCCSLCSLQMSAVVFVWYKFNIPCIYGNSKRRLSTRIIFVSIKWSKK